MNVQAQSPDTLSLDTNQSRIDVRKYFSNAPSFIRGDYSFGIPEMLSTNHSLHNYSITGAFGFDVMKIPVIVEGQYNSFQSYSGINSYFTIRLDAPEYANRKKLLKGELVDSLKQHQLKVDKEIFEVEGKLSFLESLESNYKQGSDRNLTRDLIGNRYGKPNLSYNSLDSSGFANGIKDSLSHISLPEQNLDRDSLTMKGDTARPDFQDKLNEVASLKAKLEELKKKKAYYETQMVIVEEYDQYLSISETSGGFGIQKYLSEFLRNCNKLEIGLARPNNSEFLLSGLPVLGFHIESEIEKNYISVSGGRIFNPRIRGYSDIESSSDFLGYFGFPTQSIQYEGIQAKGGLGSRAGNHIHLGWLGARSSNLPIPERHSIIELDTRLAMKFLQLDFAVATSTNNIGVQQVPALEADGNGEKQLINRTAGKLKLRAPIKSTNTILKGSANHFGSEFFSPGMGFQRAGLLTYKIEAEQKLARKTSLKAFYGQEADGLLVNQMTYNVFERWGVELSQRIGKALKLTAGFSPITQQLVFKRDDLTDETGLPVAGADSLQDDRTLASSYMANFNVNWSRRFDEITFSAFGLYQIYSIGGSGFEENYDLFTASLFIDVSGKYQFNVMGSSILPQGVSTTLLERHTASASINYAAAKSWSITFDGEAIMEGDLTSFGYGAHVQVQISPKFQCELGARKLVADYFNNTFLMPNYGLNVPYRITTSLTWNI